VVASEPTTPPSQNAPGEAPAKWHVSIAPHLVVRFGAAPAGIPVIGYGGGVSFARALFRFARRLRFGVGAEVGYDRLPGDAHFLAHATFAGTLFVDAPLGRVRPYVVFGGGLSASQYQDSSTAMLKDLFSAAGLVHLALGFDVRVWRSLDIGLRGELDFTFAGIPELTSSYFVGALELGSSF
jgi:hypothetical protein